MADKVTIGAKFRTYAYFYLNEILTDPTTVQLYHDTPDKVRTLYVYGVDAEIVKESVGTYYFEYRALTVGPNVFRWDSDVEGWAASDIYVIAAPSVFI